MPRPSLTEEIEVAGQRYACIDGFWRAWDAALDRWRVRPVSTPEQEMLTEIARLTALETELEGYRKNAHWIPTPSIAGGSTVAVPIVPTNQCDGCRRGLPIIEGIHVGQGYDRIGCTAHLYQNARSALPCESEYVNAQSGYDGETGG